MVGIEASKLFGSLSAAELETLKQTAELRTYPAEHTLFQEGDAGDGIYIVRSGSVQISALVGPDQRKVLSLVGPGDFFGEMAVLDSEPRSATAVTGGASELYFIPRGNMLEMLEKMPKLAVSMVTEFSLRMRDFNRRYIQETLQAERLTLVGKFARSIVHDFKNPLNIIGLAAELTCMEKSTPGMRQAAAMRIRKQVDRLSNMISELLEFTRGTQTAVALAETNFRDYVSHVLEEITAEAADKKVDLVCVNEPPNVIALLDPQRLLHVFFNLIHNAMDAMPGGGKIFLRFEHSPTELVVELEDTGKGLAPEIANRLFEPFATFGKPQGTGLGLSICKRIVEDHRGWIKARTEYGRGAIFAFSLPVARR